MARGFVPRDSSWRRLLIPFSKSFVPHLMSCMARGLSASSCTTLIGQHLACKNASRWPVLIVVAAYEAAGTRLAESVLPLNSHNAADRQTGSIGDVEICLSGDDAIVTAYEMKMK